MVKGFLKGTDGIFQLSPSITVVGRENCDFLIQSQAVEPQHAIIEYSEHEICFVLQDLNTAHGTYVNDCRVQNAAVRLAPGDVIRFGYAGVPHELVMDDTMQVSYPPVQQRLPGHTSLTLLNSHIPVSAASTQSEFPYLGNQTDFITSAPLSQSQLPQISSLSQQQHPPVPSHAWVQHSTGSNVKPHPPRPRPSSAGTRRGSGDRVGVAANSPSNSPLPTRRVTGGWVSSVGARSAVTSHYQSDSPTGHGSPVAELNMIHEKDQKILRMGDEIKRLAAFESESTRKDGLISQLRYDLEQSSTDMQQANYTGVGDSKVQLRVMELEKNAQLKQLEINALKEQMTKMRPESSDPLENVGNLRNLLNQKDRELFALKQDLEKVKKERTTSHALVSTLQRDLSNKEALNKRMKGETTLLRNQLRDREVSLSAMTAKSEEIKKEIKELKDHFNKRERDIVSLQRRLKGMEAKISDQTVELANKAEEIETLNKQVEEDRKLQAKYLTDRDQSKNKFLESQRSEKAAKVDMDQALKRLERFRSRVMQIAFSAPGFKVPEEDGEDVSDDTVAECLKHLIEERTEAKNRLRDLKESNKSLEANMKETKSSSKTLKGSLVALEQRLGQSGRTCSHLREEIRLLQSVTVDESFQGVKDTVAMILQNELAWQQEYEKALEKCGFEIKGAEQGLSKYIDEIHSRATKETQEKDVLSKKLSQIEGDLKQEMEKELTRVKTDHENKLKDHLEKLSLEGEQKLQSSLEEAIKSERESLGTMLEAERQKVQQQENSLEELRKALTDKNAEDDKHADFEKELRQKIDEMKTVEQQLKEQLTSQEEQHRSALSTIEEQLVETLTQKEKEATAHKAQLHQHSLTIVNLEERVTQTTKGREASQQQVIELRKKLEEQAKQAEEELLKVKLRAATAVSEASKQAPLVEPNPNVKALEHIINIIKRENSELKKEVQDQQDVVLGLRRDLAGASARLSDMTGELSDHQKEEMELMKRQIKQQDAELTTQRQQLVKLSELVDDKSNKVNSLTKQVESEKESVVRTKRELNAHNNEVNRLKSLLTSSEEEKKVAIRQVQQDGIITNELSGLGAQCRGERHEQVISRQREALAELRQRIKGLESNRPPLPTHDQALQQVILLKKELAEMRAKQAQLATVSEHHRDPDAVLEHEVAKARGQISSGVSDAAVERSARVEMQDAMNLSEKAYIGLTQTISRELGLGEIPGQESFAHLPKDERGRIDQERQNSMELITSRLRTLNQRLERKDDLLRDYEKDLEKLRLAEQIANEKAGQVESLANDIRGKTEEAHYLRETLRKTRETLDQERRLNNAIKNKKTFHLENDDKVTQKWPKHKCYDEEGIKEKEKQSKKTKAQKDRMVKKNYELETIKAELQDKDQQLIETTAKLINLENAIGMTS
ncbi:forkhead-associated domain-containing protein 1-like isoform X2 [Apostichopus japonicus]|uniref:forkhead-associated domain-containing protein 1-like isoform X2 n=1 Tax=Stichopus japonicus TaxID=307972 RepID=UPI003AB28A98